MNRLWNMITPVTVKHLVTEK